MNKKHIGIIVAVLIVAVIGCYMIFGNSIDTPSTTSVKQKTILLSKSAYMEVPDTENVSDEVKKNGVHYYKNDKDDINITSCSNLSGASSEKEMKKLKNEVTTGAKKSVENGVVVYEKNGTYSVFVKNTQYNDVLLIQSSDKSLLLQCCQSVQFHDPAQKVEIKNDDGKTSTDVIDVVEKTEQVVSEPSSSSSSSSSEQTSSSSSETSASESDWGYDWGSGGSGGGSSGGDSIAGGSASDAGRFDFS
jgi:hypothetical protein